MSAQETKQPNTTNVKRAERLNINRLPSTVTGVPEELFHQFSVEITITGMKSVTRRLRAINEDGTPGRIIPYEEAMKLSRAAGFVQAHSKVETRSELTELTRSLFWNGRVDPAKVKDPKVFAKLITGYNENLQKTKETISRAGEGVEDQEAKKFLTTMLSRATASLNELIADRITGGSVPESEIFKNNGFPSSLKSKFFTGSLDVAPQGRLWTSLYGKEMHRFCNLTIEELRHGMVNDSVFYPSDKGQAISRLICDQNLAELCGYSDWASTPEKMKERILSYQFPIVLPIRKVEFFRRYAVTKAQIASKNAIEGAWPSLDLAYNVLLKEEYHQPPREMKKLKEFWTHVAGQALFEPSLVSKDYRAQAIEALDDSHSEEKLPSREYELDIGTPTINGFPLRFATLSEGLYSGPDGTKIKIEKGFDKFFPVEIVGLPKKTKKKDKLRAQGMRKNMLTKKSQRFLKALQGKGLSPEILAEIKQFLQGFIHLGMQEMAAQIVYVTSEVSEREARKIVLDEQGSDDSDDDASGSGDDSSQKDDDENEEEALPALLGQE